MRNYMQNDMTFHSRIFDTDVRHAPEGSERSGINHLFDERRSIVFRILLTTRRTFFCPKMTTIAS